MNTPFSARRPFEVFNCVRQVHTMRLQASRAKRILEHLTGRADEWLPGAVLLIARLLADQNDRGGLRAGAKHCLCSGLPQVAGSAVPRG
jgi:hypothetical protein